VPVPVPVPDHGYIRPMPRAASIAIAVLAITAAGGTARADDDAAPAPSRPFRAALGLGGFAALTGPSDRGLVAVVELLPGGALGRLGGRLEARTLSGTDLADHAATAGVLFEAAAARPRLALYLHAELGYFRLGDDTGPLAGAGITTQLGLVGPLAVGLDSGATLFVAGAGSSLALASSLTLRLVR
jgi:hypothetical protein